MNSTSLIKNENQSPPRKDKNRNPYEQFATSDLILRDQLAIDRTILANERTFLAYCRTALALVLTGAGVIRFFETMFSQISGWALIGVGVIVAGIGVWRTSAMAKNIASAGKGMKNP